MVYYGIDNIGNYENLFKNKKLGLITSISGVTSDLKSSIEIIHSQYKLTALFAPEHGVRGDRDAGELVDTYEDSETGIAVHSLYRKDSKRLTDEMLDLVDAVIYDIQDVGTRYYTFITTMLYALEDCARAGRELILLDRPNPLSGNIVEGISMTPAYKSFVGGYEMPIRYGMTAGELAVMMNDEMKLDCQLTVIPCQGLKSDMLFPDMGNHWLMPSLGIPRFDTALLYPGTCLIEGTTLSEGRGTSCPFEIIGSPYINAIELAKEMNLRKLNGVIFTPAYFVPTASKHKGVKCEGVHFHLTDYKGYEAVRSGIELLDAIRKLYPSDFALIDPPKQGDRRFISMLFGDDSFEKAGWSKDEILNRCQCESDAFKNRRDKYKIYR